MSVIETWAERGQVMDRALCDQEMAPNLANGARGVKDYVGVRF